MKAFLKLIRWPNLLMVAATMYLTRYFLIQPFYILQKAELQLSNFNFFIFVLGAVLISAGGYIINDIFDLFIDPINRPKRMVVGNQIPKNKAENIYYIISGIGVALEIYIGFVVKSVNIGFLFLIAAMIFYFYSLRYKRIFFWGNFVVSFLTGFVPIIVWLVEFFATKAHPTEFATMATNLWLITWFVLGFGLFAFFTSLIRELIKDIEDREGDARWGCNTIPVVWGVAKSKQLALIYTIALLVLTLSAAYMLYDYGISYLAGFSGVVIGLPLLFFISKLLKADSNEDFHFLSTFMKIIMAIGVLSMIGIYQTIA